ncbi:MAG: hypothetical protein ACRETD_11015, partial [Steroidobacteraceae bacterium]
MAEGEMCDQVSCMPAHDVRGVIASLSLAFAATSNRLAPDAPLSPLTPLSARSQWNLGLPFAQETESADFGAFCNG